MQWPPHHGGSLTRERDREREGPPFQDPFSSFSAWMPVLPVARNTCSVSSCLGSAHQPPVMVPGVRRPTPLKRRRRIRRRMTSREEVVARERAPHSLQSCWKAGTAIQGMDGVVVGACTEIRYPSPPPGRSRRPTQKPSLSSSSLPLPLSLPPDPRLLSALRRPQAPPCPAPGEEDR